MALADRATGSRVCRSPAGDQPERSCRGRRRLATGAAHHIGPCPDLDHRSALGAATATRMGGCSGGPKLYGEALRAAKRSVRGTVTIVSHSTNLEEVFCTFSSREGARKPMGTRPGRRDPAGGSWKTALMTQPFTSRCCWPLKPLRPWPNPQKPDPAGCPGGCSSPYHLSGRCPHSGLARIRSLQSAEGRFPPGIPTATEARQFPTVFQEPNSWRWARIEHQPPPPPPPPPPPWRVGAGLVGLGRSERARDGAGAGQVHFVAAALQKPVQRQAKPQCEQERRTGRQHRNNQIGRS